jgi:hypothetical protein
MRERLSAGVEAPLTFAWITSKSFLKSTSARAPKEEVAITNKKSKETFKIPKLCSLCCSYQYLKVIRRGDSMSTRIEFQRAIGAYFLSTPLEAQKSGL